MSGCADVCLDMDSDYGGSDFYRESIVKARKSHQCCECGDAIASGQTYERASGKSDGDMWSFATCASCAAIRDAFVCGSWIYGMLWESIEEGMFPVWDRTGPIDCLAKLETLEARDKCRQRYQQWREGREP